jgi:hypothetical protein
VTITLTSERAKRNTIILDMARLEHASVPVTGDQPLR